MNYIDKLNTLDKAISAIKQRAFVVASVDQYGNFSMSANPCKHISLNAALAEANRLASQTPGKTFVALQLAGGRLLPNVVNVSSF